MIAAIGRYVQPLGWRISQAGIYIGNSQFQRQASRRTNKCAVTNLHGRILHHHRDAPKLVTTFSSVSIEIRRMTPVAGSTQSEP